jgi:signal transduction histidine kinase
MMSDAGAKSEFVPEVPDHIVRDWETIVATMAELINVPAGLIMRVRGLEIEVFRSCGSSGNPYKVGEAERLHESGLYCETVIANDSRLLVADALADPAWCDNPDVPRGMISYLGFPIRWPDKRPFGTICVLDNKANLYNPLWERLIQTFRDVIEHHLDLIMRDAEAEATLERQSKALDSLERRFRDARSGGDGAASLSTVGQFAGAVVHEINQPLAAISASIASFKRWLDQDTPDLPAARAAVERMQLANRRASEVVAGLRSLAERTAHRAEFDLEDLVQETLRLGRDDLDRAGVIAAAKIDPACRRAIGDRLQVQLVFMNLIRNAAEAMRDVEDRERQLVISMHCSDAEGIVVAFEDSGIGFGALGSEQIFEASVSTKAVGMGLGLAICRSIVEAHGGAISARPRNDGPGARFTFNLPQRTTVAPPREGGRCPRIPA